MAGKIIHQPALFNGQNIGPADPHEFAAALIEGGTLLQDLERFVHCPVALAGSQLDLGAREMRFVILPGTDIAGRANGRARL
jgi:hypothetical protein